MVALSPTIFFDLYNKLMSRADPRVEHLPLMSSPIPHCVIMLFYLWIVKKGPGFMANRKPFELRGLMIFYNLFIVLWTIYMFYEFLAAGWLAGYSLGCQPVDYSNSPLAIRMLNVSWMFFVSKIVELCDTMFFILRKKKNQISFLHVFHHAAMPCCWWWGVKFVPGGMGTFHGMINCVVHIIMYTYYALSAIGPHMQKYLFWKRYITRIQMVQFVIIFSHMGQGFFVECDYPMAFVIAISGYALIFLVLFANFYIKAYVEKKSTGKRKSSESRAEVDGNNKFSPLNSKIFYPIFLFLILFLVAQILVYYQR